MVYRAAVINVRRPLCEFYFNSTLQRERNQKISYEYFSCLSRNTYTFVLNSIAGPGIWKRYSVYSLHALFTGRAKEEKIPMKIRYLWNCSNFFAEFTVLTLQKKIQATILQISLQYLVVLKNYNYLNCVHFSK